MFGFGFSDSLHPNIDLIDENDYAYLADNEVPLAPIDNGFYEGGQRKPVNAENEPLKEIIPNKWCVRECERCVMSKPNEFNLTLELKNFDKRLHNYHAKNDINEPDK